MGFATKEIMRCTGALVVVFAACLFRSSLEHFLGPGLPPFITFYPAIMLVALMWGLLPGLLATGAAVLMTCVLIFPLQGVVTGSLTEVISLLLFTGMGVFMSIVAVRYRRLRIHPEELAAQRSMVEWNRKMVGESGSRMVEFGDPAVYRRTYSTLDTPLRDADGNIVGAGEVAYGVTEQVQTQEALRMSEERLRLALDSARMAAWDWHVPSGDVVWNDVHYRMMGYTPGEVRPTYRAWADRVHPDDLAAAETRIRQCMADRSIYTTEFRTLWPDGTVRCLEARGKFEYDSSGQPLRCYGVMLDTTEQKLAEEALRESKERYRTLASATFEGIVVSEQGRIVDANDQILRMLGYTYDEFIGRNVADFLSPEDRTRVMANIGDSLDACTEHDLIRKDGTRVTVEAHGQTILSKGLPVRYTAVRDISERKKIEQAILRLNQDLQQRVAELQTIFETVPIGLAIAEDPQGAHIHGNSVNEQLLGLAAGSELSKRSNASAAYRIFQDGRELGIDELPMQRAVRGELVQSLEMEVLRADGSFITLLTNAAPLLDGTGMPRGAVGVFLDITRRRQLELRLDLLARTAGTLLVTDFPQKAIETFCAEVMSILDCHVFFNFLVDEATGRLHLNTCSGIPLEEQKKIAWLDLGEAVCGGVAREARRIVAENIRETPDLRTELVNAYGIQSYACHPLMSDSEVLGTLSFGSRTRTGFNDEDLAFMQAVAGLVASALERKLSGDRLKMAHDRLEAEVSERTRELREALEALKAEMTERLRTAEALREKDRILMLQSRLAAMGEMIGNIAHQWRQPLNTLGLVVQDLLFAYEQGDFTKEMLDSRTDKAMQVIIYMSRTIDDFRNFFRPEKERVPFRVSQVVANALNLISGSFQNQQIRLDVENDTDPVLIGYPNEFSQVLLNILANARDAVVERSVDNPRVTIAIGGTNGKAVVIVRDNAGGIPEEIQGRIFEPYFTTKGPEQGTGLGLFMAKTIIESSMKGRLTVRNTAGGAEFTIEV